MFTLRAVSNEGKENQLESFLSGVCVETSKIGKRTNISVTDPVTGNSTLISVGSKLGFDKCYLLSEKGDALAEYS